MLKVSAGTSSRSTYDMNVTGWPDGLEVTGGGTGIVSHAGLGLLRRLADRTGLTGGLSQALVSGRVLGHDRGRVLADISCAIADGARAISDFRVPADQKDAFGQVASVPTAYRTLEEISKGGTRIDRKLTAAISTARRYAWTQIVARHGKLPGGAGRGQDPGRRDLPADRRDRHLCSFGQGTGRAELQRLRPSSAAGVLR
jgi:hypothetical protein